jgi:methyltransferase
MQTAEIRLVHKRVYSGMWIWVALVALMVQRLSELRLAQRNLRWALANGGREYARGHYPLFFVLHVGWMLGWVVEGLARGSVSPIWWVWLLVFLLGQGLRYWAIASLGKRWNTRIVIVPGGERVTTGPYKFIAHPNYLAVALELLALPLVFGAWVTALVASVLNALLLLYIRIPAEEKALKELA